MTSSFDNNAPPIEPIRVSVIIPAYNAERYISDAIHSVLNQDLDRFELLIVDDGSTDSTASIIHSFSDRRICFLQQENLGVCAARNRGLEEARGDYVVFLDSDDLILPDKLSAQLELFEFYRPYKQRLEIINSGWTLIRADGGSIDEIKPWENAPQLNTKTWLLWKPIFPGALMLDRKAVLAVGGFDTDLKQAEDVDLILRLAASGSEALWLYRSTVMYRQHEHNASLSVLRQAADITRVIEKFYEQPDLGKDLRKLERRVRYNTLIWLIWRLYENGLVDESPSFLKQALNFSPYQPLSDLTVIDWQVKLQEHACRQGASPQVMREFWPAFREAANLPASKWDLIQRSLAFHLELWQQYTFTDVNTISTYRQIGVDRLIKAAAPVVFVSYQTRPADICYIPAELLQDANINSGNRIPGFSGLFLILATKKFYEGSLRDFLTSLWLAVQNGITLKSLKLWAHILKTTVRSFLHARGKI